MVRFTCFLFANLVNKNIGIFYTNFYFYMSQEDSQPLSQFGESQNTDTENEWPDWENFSHSDQSVNLRDLFAEIKEASQKQQLERLLNAATGVSEDKLDDDEATVTTITKAAGNQPTMDLVDKISGDLLEFVKSRTVTAGQLQLAYDQIKDVTTAQMKTMLGAFEQGAVAVTSETTVNTLKQLQGFLSSFLPKPDLDIEALRAQLDKKIEEEMKEEESKFINIRASVNTNLQITAASALNDEATEKSKELLSSLDGYKAAIDGITDLYSKKDLNNEQKLKILSLWNNLLSLDGLIKQYNDSQKMFNIEEFQIIIDFLDDLTKQIQDLITEVQDLPDIKRTKTEEVVQPKSAFSLEGLAGMFSMGKKGGKRNTKKGRRSSKKANKTGGKKTNTKTTRKANRKTKRSRK
jgi:hypothetical protein